MGQPVTEENIRRTYHATIDGLYRYVSSHCHGDRDLAEDIVQESWLRAVRSWQVLPEEPAAWLTTVARNLLATHFRKRATEFLDEANAASIAIETPDDPERRTSLLHRALARVPRRAARLLNAFHLQQRRVADIAVEEGLSERAVEGRLRRARQQLRQQISTDPESEGEFK